MSPASRGRRPGPSTSRDEILAAARELFARHGYERASLRAIASKAKVDPALIAHFFGSKEGLLRQALTPPLDPAPVIGQAVRDAPAQRRGEYLVRGIVSVWDNPAVNPVLLSMLRTGLSHDLAMTVLRQTLQSTVITAVAGVADQDDANTRAQLVAAHMVGVAVARYLLRLPEVAAMTPDELGRVVGPAVQHYLTDPL